MKVSLDCLGHHIRCYAHIINICSSHIVASVTSTSKSYLFNLKIPVDSNYVASGGQSDDDLDDDYDPGHDMDCLELAGYFDARGDVELERWFTGIKRNPLRCA